MNLLDGDQRPMLLKQQGVAASARRISGLVLRYWYVIRSSWPRTAELIYWPLVQMIMWGFLQKHLAATTSLEGRAAGLFIGGVLLWDILVRSQLGFSTTFLEEVWSRNLGHLMMSPIRAWEMGLALMVVSLVKLSVAMVPVMVLADVFFGFNAFGLGVAFGVFFANLVMTSWALGFLAVGAVIRWGLGAESLAWLIVFVLLPLVCVYYPLQTLPGWLQPVALALPPTHVFEGLRALVLEGRFEGGNMAMAFVLNIVYLAVGFGVFRHLLEVAREAGSLVQMGE